MQAQLWPTSRREIEAAREHGVENVEQVFTTEELVSGEVIVAATGVSNGDLLRGVRFLADSARTHSLVMCTRCNWVRFVDGIHFFAREPAARRFGCSATDGAMGSAPSGPSGTVPGSECAPGAEPPA